MGWKTVEVRRKDVPDQKACIAVPERSLAIIYRLVLVWGLVGEEGVGWMFTGRATDMEVASRAAIRVRMQRDTKARMNRHPTL